MELKILLDFDGVLFNSAFEAFCVSNACTKGRPGYRQEVSFEEFLEYRAFVTDAWQFHRLYDESRLLHDFAQLPDVVPDDGDWAFSTEFFDTRAGMMKDPNWPKIMSPYDFFFLLRPMLLKHPERFAILSTRNVSSIKQTMAFFAADVLPIFGQEDIRAKGSKLKVAADQGWLANSRYMVVYVDDMNSHLEPFDGKVHLPLHANWGYDRAKADSLSPHQVLTIISSLLKLSGIDDVD